MPVSLESPDSKWPIDTITSASRRKRWRRGYGSQTELLVYGRRQLWTKDSKGLHNIKDGVKRLFFCLDRFREKAYCTAAMKLRRGKWSSIHTEYSVGGALMTSTENMFRQWKEYSEDLCRECWVWGWRGWLSNQWGWGHWGSSTTTLWRLWMLQGCISRHASAMQHVEMWGGATGLADWGWWFLPSTRGTQRSSLSWHLW